MRYVAIAALVAVMLGSNAQSFAGTTSHTIPVQAQIVPGKSVSVYVNASGTTQTVVTDEGSKSTSSTGGKPALTVTFSTDQTSVYVNAVQFNRSQHLLTINF